MFKNILNWIKQEPKILLVEIEKNLEPTKLTEESRSAVTSLGDHVGFQYLLAKLRFQEAYLVKLLKTAKGDSRDEIQMAIKWASWLETTLLKELDRVPKLNSKVPSEAAQIAFREIHSALEYVGQETKKL